jgi:ketosteroid isomerase-like protein
MDTATVVRSFYEAFKRRDGDAMAELYAPDARFEDPAFSLDGRGAGDMWRMLTTRGKDLELDYRVRSVEGTRALVDWVARYTFSGTGRRVVNEIAAEITVRDGRIVDHVDRFDFWRWSRQALGPAGLLLGWSPLLRRKVRAEAARSLAAFQARRGAG